jgi:hypothetical protein
MKGANGWLIRWDFSSVGKPFSKDHEKRLGVWAKHPHPHTPTRFQGRMKTASPTDERCQRMVDPLGLFIRWKTVFKGP